MQTMHGLLMSCLLILFLMIYGIGYLVWKIWRRQDDDAMERAEIRNVAETAAIIAETAATDAASCAAVIDRLEKPQPGHRHMHAVRDDRTGVTAWSWKEMHRG